jgi:uncharacterized protein (DUF362 family)/Pyruvate/2-oxoacid:ferredoxin oxidoreductase delta subunit
MSRVLLYSCEQYDEAAACVRAALEALCPDVSGKRVLIKPNMLGPCVPEMCVTTHPVIVRAAVDWCRDCGAGEVIVGDNPGMTGYGSSDQTARISGILEAADGCYRNLAQDVRTVEIASGRGSALPISGAVLDADVVINLAKMKTHVATGLTGAVKNTFGYVVGAAKTRLHASHASPADFARSVAEVFALRPPDVSITDAVMAMEGQGPSGGRPRHVGLIMASCDAPALDAVMARLMGLDAADVLYLSQAARMGLGTISAEEIQVERIALHDSGAAAPGGVEAIAGYRPPTIGRGLGTTLARWLSWLFITQPRADRRKCVRCGTCARQCPVEVIEMNPFPVIDAAGCISCFCCHEFCKFQAMNLSPRVRLFRFLRGGRRRRTE